jgi:alpha-ketoglutarate-dependent taurine dioxygenase
MLRDFLATWPSQPQPIPNPTPMLRDSPATGPDRAESVLQDIPATRLGCTTSPPMGTATALVPMQRATTTVLGPAKRVSQGSPASSSGQRHHVLFPASTFEVINSSPTTSGPLRRSARPALSYEPETGKWVRICDP